jgi:aminopeptidase 2
LIKETLSLPLGGEVKEQDIYLPISGLQSHPESIEALYNWMQDNWDELARRLSASNRMLRSIVTICTSNFTRENDKARVEKFFSKKSNKGFEMGLAQSLESIQGKAAWLARDRKDVEAWIKENGYAGKSIKDEL